jgi:hypothetical protein
VAVRLVATSSLATVDVPTHHLLFRIIMSIIYSLISKHQSASDDIVLLTTYDSATGNYPTVVINLLKKMVGKQTRITYEYGTE